MQVAKFEQERMDLNSQIHSLGLELEKTRQELTKATSQFKTAQDQIESLMKEKGVAMRDNAASYQQTIQDQTRLSELQAEKDILEQQRDIANKEREKVISEVVALRRKLETIKTQRQKDAKDLSAMRHLKDKAAQGMEKLRNEVEQLSTANKSLEEKLATMQASIVSAKLGFVPQRPKASTSVSSASADSGSIPQDLEAILDRLKTVENDRKVICKRLFGADVVTDGGHLLNDIVHKLDSLVKVGVLGRTYRCMYSCTNRIVIENICTFHKFQRSIAGER